MSAVPGADDSLCGKQTIIITRPQRSARRLAAQLQAREVPCTEIILSPLLEIVPLGMSFAVDTGTAVVLTSENAVHSANLESNSRNAVAFCVGDRTAKAAAQAGFGVRIASNSAGSLVSMIQREGWSGDLIHLRGRYAAIDVAGTLRASGLCAREIVVYDQQRCRLTGRAKEALTRTRCILPMYSARTARILTEETPGLPDLGHIVCCLSRNIARSIGTGWRCETAREPTSASLHALVHEMACGQDGAVPMSGTRGSGGPGMMNRV